MPGRRWGGFALILLLLPVAAYLGWRQGRATVVASSDIPLTAANSESETPVARRFAGPASASPLPSLQTPLRDALPLLRQRADAGEPAAACRLAAEMEYCNQIRHRLMAASEALQEQETLKRNPASGLPPDALQNMREMMAANSERLLKESEHCEGVPPATAAERIHYWRQAALGGSTPALRHYAVGNAFRLNETLDNLDALAVYRREAEAMAWRGASAGDLQTSLALASALSPRRNEFRRYFLAQAVRPDEVKALALYLHLERQLGDAPAAMGTLREQVAQQVGELSAALAPDARSRAREIASGYAREWTRHSWAPGSSSPLGMQGGTPDAARTECAAPAGGPAG